MPGPKPPTGNKLRALPKCDQCGGRLRGPRSARPTKRCPTCGLVKPRSEWTHSKARMDHMDSQCRDCKAIREGRERRRPPGAPPIRGERHRLTVLSPPFGELNEMREDTVTGTVSWVTRPHGWVETERSGTLINVELPESQHNGAWVVYLDEVYFTDTLDDEFPVLLDSEDRFWRFHFYTDQGGYVEGSTATVSFDAGGEATQIENVPAMAPE